MSRIYIYFFLAVTLALPLVCSAEPQDRQMAPAPVMSASVLLQVVLGLALVLGLVIGTAWLLKRFTIRNIGGNSVIRILSSAAVGQRERVVLLEVADTWLVVGVAQGQVNALHHMSKTEIADSGNTSPNPKPNFSAWLKQVMERRHGK